MQTNPTQINDLHRIDLYLHFYGDAIDDQRTEAECEFIIRECQLAPGMDILDLACGHGRHANSLAAKGYPVTGIDLNADFIDLARQHASQKGLSIDFRVDSMLNLEAEDAYDCIILVFNSFGFLDREDGIKLIQRMKSALKSSGKMFLDIKNRDSILKELTGCHVTEKGQDLMIDRLSFDPREGTTTNQRIYIKDGVRYDTPFTMQLYNYSEFSSLMEQHGLNITRSFGSWSGKAFGADSRRIIAVVEKG